MPNHVMNVVKMEGITRLPLFTMEYDKFLERDVENFDFNKIIPMPESLNITSGSVTDQCIVYYLTERCTIPIACLEDGGAEMRKMVKNSFSNDWVQEVFNRVMECAYKASESEKEKMYRDGKTYVENYRNYGHTTWYDWCCSNWGTKWNAYEYEQVDEDTIEFETAWSNPEPVMLKLSKMYPEETIEHWWADEDMGNNSGYRVYQNGEIVEGDYNDFCSSEAYETYIKCWGETNCLYQDEEGLWKRRSCEECEDCD